MAEAFPKVPSKSWRALRSRAAAAPSNRFTPAAVAAILGLSSPRSAADNVVYPLRKLGLINDDGGLTERGHKWRNDATYAAACDEILAEVYPQELAGLTNGDGEPDPQQILTWFQHRGFGDSNARQMAATYTMIASREVPEPPTANEPKKASPKVATKAASKGAAKPAQDGASRKQEGGIVNDPPPPGRNEAASPNIHLDIQVHIPATASPEQIDQIFASMAKHLYNK